MIISPTHGFVFVHVPKCAGTSVRTQIAQADPDHIAMGEPQDHPELGVIDYGHIPLPVLRTHFAGEYAYLDQLPAFAVIRDPLSRFGSSLRQTLWRFEKTPMTLIEPDVLQARMTQILEEVKEGFGSPAAETIFYARQRDFIFDGETRKVDHLIPIEHVGAFISYLSRATGTAMDADRRSNQNVDLKAKWLGPIAFGLNGAIRRILPLGLHARIKDAALKVLATDQSAAQSSGVLDMPQVRDFVAEHYAEDTALYDLARTEAQTLLPRMAADEPLLGAAHKGLKP